MSDHSENKPPTDEESQGRTLFHVGEDTMESGKRIPTLLVIRGKNIGDEYVLRPPAMTIGRTVENDIYINDPRISRGHAKVLVEETDEERAPNVVLIDLGSTNGIRVNEEKVTEATLQEGDKVGMGDTILRFNHQDVIDLRYQSQIKSLRNIDNLTRLLTKRAFDIKFEHALNHAANHRQKISVLMMDLDHFKKVNDEHDHLLGSFVLHEVGKIIKQVLDPHGVSGRYGGEEFVTFLPAPETSRGGELAEELRIAMAGYLFEKDDTSINVTISIGVSTYPEDGSEPDILIQKADHALYRAKADGRNLVRLA